MPGILLVFLLDILVCLIKACSFVSFWDRVTEKMELGQLVRFWEMFTEKMEIGQMGRI